VTAVARVRSLLPAVSTLARWALAVVWGYAGLSKVADPEATVRAVRAYRLLPEPAVLVMGYGLPFLEIGLAVLLLFGLATRVLGSISAVLFVAFIVGVASAWARGLAIDCGCFGGGGQIDPGATRYVQEIIRDVGFLAIAAWLIVFPRSRLAVESRLAPAGGSGDVDDTDDGAEDDGAESDGAEDDGAESDGAESETNREGTVRR
jgi:uncharacterized membrane protein YphA (DoxX/SURF4 family)